MEELDKKLLQAYEGLMDVRFRCSDQVNQQCHMKELTFTQMEYLKIIDQYEAITISDLAEYVKNSKPTVTEMIKKFIRLDCVYKERCSSDGRKAYIMLTERGKKIARTEEYTMQLVVTHIRRNLAPEEIAVLIDLMNKISQA